jgi:hypothetical protein
MTARGIVVIVVLALLGAACGGSGSGSATAPNTAAQLAKDAGAVKAAVLTVADLPAGYKSTPVDNSNNNIPKRVTLDFASCTKLPQAEVERMMNNTKDASTPSAEKDFEKSGPGSDIGFQGSVELDRSSKDLSDPLDRFGRPSAAPCWKALFRAAFTGRGGLSSGERLSGLDVKPLLTSKLGDQAAGFQAVVTVSVGARSVPATIDFYFVRTGRAGVTLFSEWIGTPGDTNLETSLIQTMVDRVKSAAS